MRRASLRGPFNLDDEIIDDKVAPRRPGVFLLGGSGVFTPENGRVGRSDSDVNNQLHVYVDSYRYFSFQYCSTAQEAFESECTLFHEVDPKDNILHPLRPPGTDWKCPRCNLLG